MRSVDADDLFETFMVSAVTTVLTVRAALAATGYPSIGGRSLHIAHMLWGGLLMLVAIMLLLGYLGRDVKYLAAVVGGVGFGLFIDELGKFVTRNNDYFYKPTIALIYAVFVLVFIVVRATQRGRLDAAETVANALELTEEAARHQLDRDERRRALELLRRGDQNDPVVGALSLALTRIAAVSEPTRGPVSSLRARARALYRWLIEQRWFTGVAMGLFVLHAVVVLVQAAVLAARRIRPHVGLPPVSFFDAADLTFSVLPAALVMVGVLRFPRDRIAAYKLLRDAVVIEIFVTEFFAFYKDQFLALAGLFANIVILAILRYGLAQERHLRRERSGGALDAPRPAG